VKNHDFTLKNHIFSNCGGRRENFWGISYEKSRFDAKKSDFFPVLGGARAGCAPLPWIRPVIYNTTQVFTFDVFYQNLQNVWCLYLKDKAEIVKFIILLFPIFAKLEPTRTVRLKMAKLTPSKITT
jgi:hypothetical protein